MPFSPRLSRLAVAAFALLSLSGCVAAPLAQMAISQMSSPAAACPGCSAPAPGAFDDLSKGMSSSFQKFTGAWSGNQPQVEQVSAK